MKRVLAIAAVAAFAAVGFAEPASAAPAPAASQSCADTTVAGTYDLFQSNYGETLSLTIFQDGATLSGTFFNTPLTGTIDGDQLTFKVDYGPSRATYTATVSGGQLVGGYTSDSYGNSATFTAIRTSGGECPVPTTKDECKNGGFSNYGNPAVGTFFKNQGDCVSFVASEGKSDAHQ